MPARGVAAGGLLPLAAKCGRGKRCKGQRRHGSRTDQEGKSQLSESAPFLLRLCVFSVTWGTQLTPEEPLHKSRCVLPARCTEGHSPHTCWQVLAPQARPSGSRCSSCPAGSPKAPGPRPPPGLGGQAVPLPRAPRPATHLPPPAHPAHKTLTGALQVLRLLPSLQPKMPAPCSRSGLDTAQWGFSFVRGLGQRSFQDGWSAGSGEAWFFPLERSHSAPRAG